MLRLAFHKQTSAGWNLVWTSAALLVAAIAILHAPAAAEAGPWRAEEGNTPGWALMSPAERVEHQAIVRGLTSYDACRAYQIAHHRLMEERAEQRDLPAPGGAHDFCEHLRPTHVRNPE